MTLVSVIIPTYNRARLVTRTIDSVLAQTYRDIEVIVIDDGSTDDTRAVLEGYGDRITVIYQTNGGAGRARNTGLRAAHGELLNLVDSDDIFLPTKLEHQVAYLEKHPESDVVLCGWRDVDDADGRTLAEITALPVDDMLKTCLLARNEGLLSPHVLLMRRRCVERTGFFDETLPIRETEDYWLRMALAGCRFGMVEEVLCVYANRSDGRGKSLEKLEQTMPTILRKVFSHPQLPAEIAAMKDEIYARSAISFALHHYQRQDLPPDERRTKARALMRQALAGKTLVGWQTDTFDPIVYMALARAPKQPEIALQVFLDQVCGGLAQRQWLYAHLFGKLHAINAFRAYEAGRRTGTIYHILRGLAYDRRLLNNRGIAGLLKRVLISSHAEAGRGAS